MLLPFYQEGVFEAGTDEAGRGPLAGPVVAAAVILPLDEADNPLFTHPHLTDSKKLTEKQREELRPLIMEHSLAYGIARVEADEIDRINILNASILAMHKAIAQAEKMLKEKNSKYLLQHIISDGNKFHPYISEIQKKTIPHKTIVKGDATYISIAAASILAKTERDHIMDSLSEIYPQYGWKKNKAYPTKDHRDAIAKYGPTPYHRMSFRLLPDPVLF
ncbi:MAG: ribonuclease HII [Bacteroidales bacterium]|nr:ribonuclease HII [Bacteroidales bacterium]